MLFFKDRSNFLMELKYLYIVFTYTSTDSPATMEEQGRRGWHFELDGISSLKFFFFFVSFAIRRCGDVFFFHSSYLGETNQTIFFAVI